jgi:hypothetical protein
MKQLTPLVLLLFISNLLLSQDLTGIWRGNFFNIREVMLGGSRYRYEVQINNKGKSAKGVTYSYQTTRFYGKASLVGVWNPGSGNLVMKEEKMEELKIQGGGEGCLMTCYLDYRKEGDREILEGTYTSRNMNNGTDCGGGKVYLEKVVDSDFEKEEFLKDKDSNTTNKGKVKPGQEDFLVKKPGDSVPTNPPTKSPTTKKPATKPPVKNQPPATTAKKPIKKTPPPVAKTTIPVKKPTTASAKKPVESSSKKPTAQTPVVKRSDSSNLGSVTTSEKPPVPSTKPAPIKVPPVLKQRQNELFQTITTSSREIVISFYDNGEIDGDTISVYDNNRLLVTNQGLSAKPIIVTIQLDESVLEHEIVMVAQNLGSIPPNTALMIVQAGDQRYTLRISSTEQKNAMVRFRYKP